jgi:hypothetical protein
MQTNFDYYYNDVPGRGLCRNNLIYTSMISKDQKTFCQWYYNDTQYHRGQNQIVDPDLMQEKWNREIFYLQHMVKFYPDLVPELLEIDDRQHKVYLKIDGPDFWQRSFCDQINYDRVLPDWQEQMLSIIQAHYRLCWHKYSMHPSSYFLVDGRLKSINYFFTYHQDEPNISIADVESHIYSTRQAEMRKYLDTLGIDWSTPQPWHKLDQLCWSSFAINYPADFIEKVRCIK